MIKDTQVAVKYKGGGSYAELPPKFSENGQYVFVVFKTSIFAYNSKTGKRYIEFKGPEEEIIDFNIYVSDNIEYVIAFTAGGVATIWKSNNGLKVRTINLNVHNVVGFKMSIKDTEPVAVVAHKITSEKGAILQVGKFHLENGRWTDLEVSIKLKSTFKIDIGGCDDNMGMCVIQRNKLYIVRLDTGKLNIKNLKKIKFTCVKWHPTEDYIITGDATGRVLVWKDLFKLENIYGVYHWHTKPVTCVCFSTSGSIFYSGGEENVLVKWSLDNPNEKNFLPRLPSQLQQINVANDNIYIAASTADNGITILDGGFNFVSIIQHLVLGDSFEAGMIFDPRTKSFVMNGIVGHLQFYSPREMHLLYNLDVVGMNKVTGEQTDLVYTQVTLVDVNRTGLWMGTVEERNPGTDNLESRLKFFFFNSEKQLFELNTSIEYPHDSKVVGIKFQPSTKEIEWKCVTIGADKVFKIWQLVNVSTIYKKGYSWRCASTAFYRGLNPRDLAFSYDGSLLVIGFDQILTTWLPDSCELKCSLVHPSYQEQIKHVAFGVDSACHLVVSASKRRLSVWNLLSLSLMWTVQIDVNKLVTNMLTPHMAVFTKHKKLFIFEPSSPNPIYSNSCVLEHEGRILTAGFLPSAYVTNRGFKWYQKSQLYFIDSRKELYCLESDENIAEPVHLIYEESHNSLYSHLLPQVKANTTEKQKPVVHHYTKGITKNIEELLDSPANMMIPLSLMCPSVLDSMVLGKNAKKDEFLVSVNNVNTEKEDSVPLKQARYEELSNVNAESTNWIVVIF